MPDNAREQAVALMKRMVIDRAIETVERNLGKNLPKGTEKALRKSFEEDPAILRQAEEIVAGATGFGQKQGLLDSGAVLLWGVAGSLAAALLWEHQNWAPEAFLAAAIGAFGLQFRGRFLQLSKLKLTGLVTGAVLGCAAVSARHSIGDFIAAHANWNATPAPSFEPAPTLPAAPR